METITVFIDEKLPNKMIRNRVADKLPPMYQTGEILNRYRVPHNLNYALDIEIIRLMDGNQYLLF